MILAINHENGKNYKVDFSVFTVPPYTKLSRQWRVSEEFAYVLKGFFILHQEGKPDEFYKRGDVGKVPLEQFHTVSTQKEGATILIFNILEPGQAGVNKMD